MQGCLLACKLRVFWMWNEDAAGMGCVQVSVNGATRAADACAYQWSDLESDDDG